ncbi:MAG: DUF4124 domain-containing protein [Steroidobacteraceae bacterium]
MSASRWILRTAMAAVLCAGLSAAVWAGNGDGATVYKWVDAHGVIHYSDRPHPNATKLTIQGAQAYAPPPPLPSDLSAAPPPAAARRARAYNSCRIAQPRNQQMLMNVHHATAIVRTDPPLLPGNRIQLFVDGRRMPGEGPAFTFPVYRGQHSVSAVVVNGFGQILCETSTVTFYVHQPSIQNPHNPVHPH